MTYRQLCAALTIVSLGCACKSPRAEPSPPQKTPAAAAAAVPAVQNEPLVAAVYGVVPGRRTFDEKDSPDYYIREAGYPPGVFAVWMPDRPRLLAFDVDSNAVTVCTRTAQPPFELPNHINAKYAHLAATNPGQMPSLPDAAAVNAMGDCGTSGCRLGGAARLA